MAASTASTTADLVNAAGTKMNDTLAPVCAMASATVPETGTATPPSKSTVWPALRGLTPPTMLVPDFSIRWVCFMPSEPVMPWTTTREFSSRKIAIGLPVLRSVRRALGRDLGGSACCAVHGLFDGHVWLVQ